MKTVLCQQSSSSGCLSFPVEEVPLKDYELPLSQAEILQEGMSGCAVMLDLSVCTESGVGLEVRWGEGGLEVRWKWGGGEVEVR